MKSNLANIIPVLLVLVLFSSKGFLIKGKSIQFKATELHLVDQNLEVKDNLLNHTWVKLAIKVVPKGEDESGLLKKFCNLLEKIDWTELDAGITIDEANATLEINQLKLNKSVDFIAFEPEDTQKVLDNLDTQIV